MRKRILSVILALCLLCTLLPAAALPASAEKSDTDIAYPVEGGNIYFDKATGTITDCDESVTKADIPAEIDGVAVTSIGWGAFESCTGLTSVTIPDSVTNIGDYAFAFCSSLTSVTIPNSVTSIGAYAFFRCSSLPSVTIPNSVTSIGKEAFYGTALYENTGNWSGDALYIDRWLVAVKNADLSATYEITEGTVGIANNTFEDCSSLTSVTIPNSVTSIGNDTFLYCDSLTSVAIPNSVTSIGYRAFCGCSSLASVTIPDSVTSIGNSAFESCNKLTDVSIGSGVTSIGEEAFYYCTSLTSVTIPNSVTSIGKDAFSGCSSLTSVTIPDSVTSIGTPAFVFCTGLTEIRVDKNNLSYSNDEFGVLFNKDKTELIQAPGTISEYTIPNGVTTIGNGAFYGCIGLTNVTIPESVTSIDDRAFSECESLTSVCFEGNAPEIGKYVCHFMNEELESIVIIPNLTLYYIEGKAGWTSPTWNGYPTATWDGVHVPVSYADVSKTAWYYDAVQYATNNGLMNGVGGGKFDPEGSMTRAMLVTVLWRYEGAPMGYDNPFTDVNAADGSWYIDAVAWAAANKIVGGVGNGKFDPEGNITREQMATILFRYAQKKCINTSKRGELSGFSDSGNVSLWAKDAVQWTVAEGIINGSDGKLLPQGNATRAQVSAILMRFIKNIAEDKFDTSGHTEVIDPAVPATCTEAGLTEGKHCAVCGTVLIAQESITALGHDYGAWSQTKEPTCTEKGEEKRTCSRCDIFETREIAAHGHTEIVDAAVPATCTEAGKTEGRHCSVCGTVLVAQETIAVLDHAWDNGVVTVEPTETEEGVKTFTCTRCEETKTESIPALNHTHSYTAVVTAPTCTEKGYTTHTCACGDSYIDTYIDALGHDYGEWTQTKEPACTEKGEEERNCSRCGFFETRELDVTDHTEVVDPAVAATCTKAGKTEGKHCSVCGTVLVAQESIAALGHDYDAWTQTKAPTCTEKGEEERNCSRCGFFETRELDVTDHTEVVDPAVAATCTEAGKTEGKHCSVCNTVLVAQNTVDALGHDYGDWTQTKEPTCTEKGEEKRACSRCDAFETREIEANGHTEVVDAAVPATCTEAGKTEGKHCSVCGTVIVAQETVAALGHDFGAWTQTKTPTCTEKGEEKRTCSRCDAFETREIAAHGHTEVVEAAVSATCTKAGKTEGKHCAVCNTVLVAQDTIAALGHDYGEWTQTKAPTCIEKGEEERNCSRCGFFETRELDVTDHTEVVDPAVAATCTEAGKTEGKHCSACGTVLIAQESVAALGHDYDAWTQTKAPTCTEKGEEERNCSRCGFFETRELDVTDHTEVVDPAVAATCTEAGKTEGKHCSACGTVLIAQESVAALGHDYDAWTQTKAPTCTEKGAEKRTCSRCDAFETREIAAHGHTEIVDAAIPATCTEKGKTEGKHCSVCGTVLIAQESIAALGHDYGDWTQTKEPTCTKKGEEKRTCSRCDIFETREIAAHGHTEVVDAAVPATCTEAGKTEGKHCSVCGTVIVAQETVDALGHDYDAWTQTKAPTCIEKGEEKRICSRCDAFETREIAAHGHTEVVDAAVPATCTEAGKTEGKHCSVCGTVLIAQESIAALGHDYGAWTQTKEPTCTEEGEEKRTCSRCDAFETRELDIVDPKHVVTAGTRKMYIGMSFELLMEYAGEPEEILSTTSGYTWYVYGTETYTDFVMAGVYENKVVAICASGADFSYRGCTAYGSVAEAEEGDTYYIGILKDKNDNSAVYGILLTDNKFRVQYAETEAAMTGESRVAFHMANAFRVLHEVSILEWCDNAATAARLHSEDMATNDYCAHTSLDGRPFTMRLKENGVVYRHCSEILCAGYYSGIGAHNAWVNSSGHRANMLSTYINRSGVGFAYGADSYYRYYAVTDFYHTR